MKCPKCGKDCIQQAISMQCWWECSCGWSDLKMKKKYNINLDVKDAHGWQTWQVKAESKEEALSKFQKGQGKIIAEELEVTNLEDFELKYIYEEPK